MTNILYQPLNKRAHRKDVNAKLFKIFVNAVWQPPIINVSILEKHNELLNSILGCSKINLKVQDDPRRYNIIGTYYY